MGTVVENINLSEVGIPVANHCYTGMQARCYQFFFFFFLRNARNKDLYKEEFYTQHSPKIKKKKSIILNVGM